LVDAFGINVTGNLTITFALAVMTFLITNLQLIKTIGVFFWMPGVPKLMRIVLAPIELLGFSLPFLLMIRLYANILLVTSF
jgi:F-type H+-transporting ATPase subunit a